jgi:hypothetical protein
MTMEYLRAQGKIPWPVERLIPIHALPFPKKVDLFNLFDVLYIDPAKLEIGFVQITSHAGKSGHKKKMLSRDPLPKLTMSPADIMHILHQIPGVRTELHIWRKIERNWNVEVLVTNLDADLLGLDQVRLEPVLAPSMKEARAMARERDPGGVRKVRRL